MSSMIILLFRIFFWFNRQSNTRVKTSTWWGSESWRRYQDSQPLGSLPRWVCTASANDRWTESAGDKCLFNMHWSNQHIRKRSWGVYLCFNAITVAYNTQLKIVGCSVWFFQCKRKVVRASLLPTIIRWKPDEKHHNYFIPFCYTATLQGGALNNTQSVWNNK